MSHPTSPSPSYDLLRAVAKRAECGATRSDVRALLRALASSMHQSLVTTGEFRMPGMFRVVTRDMPARPAHHGINPRTATAVIVPARPARRVARLRIDPTWLREVFATLPLREDATLRGLAVDHAHLPEGPIVAQGSAPRGLRRMIKSVAPLFAHLTMKQLAALFCALRDEVAERVILVGHCALTGLATLRFRARNARPSRTVTNPFTHTEITLPGRAAQGGCRGLVVKAERIVPLAVTPAQHRADAA